jgi:hypothetical protein
MIDDSDFSDVYEITEQRLLRDANLFGFALLYSANNRFHLSGTAVNVSNMSTSAQCLFADYFFVAVHIMSCVSYGLDCHFIVYIL